MSKLNPNEKLTLALSFAAFLISGISAYFQFLHVEDALSIVVAKKSDREGDSSHELAVLNKGTRKMLLMSVRPLLRHTRSGSISVWDHQHSLPKQLPIIVSPGDIVLIRLDISTEELLAQLKNPQLSNPIADTAHPSARRAQLTLNAQAITAEGKHLYADGMIAEVKFTEEKIYSWYYGGLDIEFR